MLVQGKTGNKLQKKITEKITDPTQFNLYGHGEIISPDFKLFIRGYQELTSGVKQSAAMLLDSLMITATQQGLKSTLVKLPLREYMEMRGLRDEKQRGAWLKVSIAGGTVGQIKNGDIVFRVPQCLWFFGAAATRNDKKPRQPYLAEHIN